jgi:phospholipid/cholesterol/gamma-HCH transport system substrate-binding protein
MKTSKQQLHVWVGAFTVLGIAAIFMLAIKVSNVASFSMGNTYQLTAYFENIGGLKVRSPVTMAGVVIGRVSDIKFDNDNYEAKVSMQIDEQYDNIPLDTTASIFTSGLLGDQYIGLDAGGEAQFLKHGDSFKLTQSAVVLEQLIGQLLISKAENKAEN